MRPVAARLFAGSRSAYEIRTVGNGHDRSAVCTIDDYLAPAKRDQLSSTSVIANQCALLRGNPRPRRCFAPPVPRRRTERERIATGLTPLAMTVGDGGWSFYFRWRLGRRGQCRPPYRPNSIRRAENSDRSGSFTRLPSSKIHQARIGTGTAGRAVLLDYR